MRYIQLTISPGYCHMTSYSNARTLAAMTAWLVACSLGLTAAYSSKAQGVAINVAAASDLKFALEQIASDYQRVSGQRIRLSFGSSGNFYRQIRQGAPYDLFLSADEAFVLQLASDGATQDQGHLYAIGRLVAFVPHHSPVQLDDTLEDLGKAARDGRLRRLAIANPEHAPYGRAAEETLRHLGLWQDLQGKLVLGENVSQAAQFSLSGSVQAGIFAYSLTLSSAVQAEGSFLLLPDSWHGPLRQRMVLTAQAGENARDFYNYLQSHDARHVFEQFGFTLPAIPEP